MESDPRESPVSSKPKKLKPSPLRGKGNWLIYKLYACGQDAKCAQFVDNQMRFTKGMNEYALFMKACLKRSQGQVEESLSLFQENVVILLARKSDGHECVCKIQGEEDPVHLATKYSRGKGESSKRGELQTNGEMPLSPRKAHEALLMLEEAKKLCRSDWEVFHQLGLVQLYLRKHDNAIESFENANAIERHVTTFVEMAKVHTLRGRLDEAIEVYNEALEHSPGNPEILTNLGLLHLRLQNVGRASENLGNALTYNRRNAKAVLAFASIQQQNGEIDSALSKYRVAFAQVPTSAELWNNVGMCFFEKAKFVAAISCLKRALYSDPFKWHVALNLGLAYLQTKQYVSAFLHLTAAMNLNPHNAATYMYIAIALSRMQDTNVSLSAYEKAIAKDPKDVLIRLNYATTLTNCNIVDEARQQADVFHKMWKETTEEEQQRLGQDVQRLAMQLQEVYRCE